MASLERLVESALNTLRPPPKLSLSKWSDENAVLSAESSAEAGRWKTIAYQRGIMDAITDPLIEQVSVMKSARVGYTKILNNTIGYYIHQDPCPIMLVQPTIEDAEGYSKEEVAPMIRDTPVLQGLVVDAKAKDSSNTILQKMFPGGTLSLVGANSPRGFRRVSRRIVLFDEVDGYPASAGTEGDQIKLGIRRSEYYWNRKIVAGSTPLVKDTSRIEKLFAQSDQRRYFVPCPQCDEPQYLKWQNLKWPDGEPELAHFVCEKNGCVIEHDSKRWMIEEADRRHLADPSCPYGWKATAPGNGKHAGFHIWAAYSFSPNASWGVLASEFLEAKGDTESLKTFVNTVLGELWEEEYSAKIGADGLKARAEAYEPGVCPEKTLLLTAGVDVQDNRFSISLYGYGRDEESWIVARTVIFGDPAQAEIWKQLDDVLLRPYRHALGGELKISVAAIDSGGHFTHETYAYVRERKRLQAKGQFIIAVKGQSQKGKPAIGKPVKVDVNFRGQALKSGADLYPVGSDTIKGTLYSRFKLVEFGPGYVHLNAGLPDEFFAELTAEKQITRFVKGFPVREWVKKPGARNEALDEAVYGYAALQFYVSRYNRKTFWDQMEKRLHAAGVPVESPPVTEAPENPPSTEESPLKIAREKRRIVQRRRSGGFVKGY